MSKPRIFGAALAAAIVAIPVLVFAQAVELRGAITAKEGDRITVRTADGDKTVLVAPDAKVTETAGAGVFRREARSAADLVRGLTVEIQATQSPSGDYSASSIVYRRGDLNTARAIDAGVQSERDRIAENQKKIAENEARLNNVGELAPLARTKVFFDTGSTTISETGKQDLRDLAARAKTIEGGYRLAVVGRADTTGNAAANERLSRRRAAAVTDYLEREAGVLPPNILSPTALGSSTVADDPDPPKTLGEGRRVTVTILVSKANTSVTAASSVATTPQTQTGQPTPDR